jgi:hypothetical protein
MTFSELNYSLFQNWELRTFRLKGDEGMVEWREMLNADLYNL